MLAPSIGDTIRSAYNSYYQNTTNSTAFDLCQCRLFRAPLRTTRDHEYRTTQQRRTSRRSKVSSTAEMSIKSGPGKRCILGLPEL